MIRRLTRYPKSDLFTFKAKLTFTGRFQQAPRFVNIQEVVKNPDCWPKSGMQTLRAKSSSGSFACFGERANHPHGEKAAWTSEVL
jgi:hypothetical protein